MKKCNIKIDEDLHLLLKQYCVFNGIKIESYISKLIKDDLTRFKKNLKTFKRH